jgi:predicted metal-dependent enzyme (double-stranded beta helix superfamily)
MFELERFIEDCRKLASTEGEVSAAIRERVAEAISDPVSIESVLSPPPRAGFEILHRAPDLTILNFAWPPWMPFKPHNHSMWSVVGVFSGREDNLLWRRTGATIEAVGARSFGRGQVALLGPDAIHSVVNPLEKLTRALHVYGGDFFAPPRPRSEWDPETLVERPWDLEDTKRSFEDAEARAVAWRQARA